MHRTHFIVGGTVWLLATAPLAGQSAAMPPAPLGPVAAPSAFAAWTPGPLVELAADTTARRYPATYWQEGALTGGALGGLLFGLVFAALCASSDVEQGCAGPTLGAVLLGGSTGAALGALVGGLFPKSEPDATAAR